MSVLSVRSEVPARYFPAFDYLRFVLAFTVLLGHGGLLPWDRVGSYCVQVFFALSGWLIGGILLRSSASDIPKFYFNRASRIWIPYFASISLLMVASLLKPITSKWGEIFFYNWTFVYNLFGPPLLAAHVHDMPLDGTGNHFWSICAEEQFYLLAPLILVALPQRIGRSPFFWLATAAICWASPYSEYFTAISLGVLAAVSVNHLGPWHADRRPIFLVVAIAALAIIMRSDGTYPFVAPFGAVATILALSAPGTEPSKFGALLGGISYPLYLNQWVGGFMANAIAKHIGLMRLPILSVFLSLVVATALYCAIDAQIKRYRSSIFTTSRGLAAASIAVALVACGILGHLILFS